MNIYFGDIHNHCDVSYGHGDLRSALKNASLQLNFTSITGHALWPDIPQRSGHLEKVVDYHVNGFTKFRSNISDYTRVIEEWNQEGRFITFPSYEIHSCSEGDYVVYSAVPIDTIPQVKSMKELRILLKKRISAGERTFLIPHHIGYKKGYRGINWETFDTELSPFVEIISMHGVAESDDYSGIPYLHTMGPLHYENTVRGGLDYGSFFGIAGSTDHHNAHPGSYGYGRIAVLADSLSRDALWDAMENRKIYAITGDKIWLETTFDGFPMGSILRSTSSREMEINIKAGYALETVNIIKNGFTVGRFNLPECAGIWGEQQRQKGKVVIEVGWGEKGVAQNWDFTLEVIDGDLLNIEPRFHGIDIVDPLDDHVPEYQFTDWERNGTNRFSCKTITWGNPTSHTSSVQGFSLEIFGTCQSSIKMTMGTWTRSYSLERLIKGDHTDYLADFLSSAVKFGRFIPEQEYTANLRWKDKSPVNERDDYYIKVIQKNNQRAWSSPIRILQ